MATKEVVEELIIVEEYDSDENMEWVLGSDGEYYCVVEEYEEEIEDVAPRLPVLRSKSPRSRSTSSANRRIHPFRTSSSSSALLELDMITRPKELAIPLTSIDSSRKKSKKKSSSSKKTSKLERRNSDSTLAVKSPSALKKFRAKQQANTSAISSQLRNRLRQKQDRIYGETLEVLVNNDTRRANILEKPPKNVPYVVHFLIQHLRERGLDSSGLFRECGTYANQLQIEEQIESGVPLQNLDLTSESIHTVADVLKSFFRQLPEPVIPRIPFCSLLIQESSIQDTEIRAGVYRAVVHALPTSRFQFLSYIVQFMVDTAQADNLMDNINVAKIFASLLLGSIEDDLKGKKVKLDPMLLYKETHETSYIAKFFMEQQEKIFDSEGYSTRIYKALEPFKPTSKAYLPLVKGDVLIYIRDTASGGLLVKNQTVGELPKSFITKSMKPVKLASLRVHEVARVLSK